MSDPEISPDSLSPEPVTPAPVSPADGRPASGKLIAAAVGAGLIGLLTVLVVVPGGAPPTALDQSVFDLTADWTRQAPWAVDAAAAIGVATDVAASTVFGVFTTLLLLARRMWVFAIFVASCGIAGVAMVETLKHTVGRQRPPGADEFIADGLDRSFPSGHASVGVYLFAAVAILVVIVSARRQSRVGLGLGVVLAAFGIVIGLSRIVIGVHWATDVLAGWALSSVIVLMVTMIVAPQRQPASGAEPPARHGP